MHLSFETRNQCLLHWFLFLFFYTFFLLQHLHFCVSASLLLIDLPKNSRAHPPPTLWQGKELVPHLYALDASLPSPLLRIDYSRQYRQLQGTKLKKCKLLSFALALNPTFKHKILGPLEKILRVVIIMNKQSCALKNENYNYTKVIRIIKICM